MSGLRAEARQNLIERLHDGKTVGGLDLRDLIDGDLNGIPRAEFATLEITNLLLADSAERAAMADKYVEGVIDRYLTTKDDLVEQELEAIKAARYEDAQLAEAGL